jgi:ABC-type glycerol-3-phosphate transport system permease component
VTHRYRVLSANLAGVVIAVVVLVPFLWTILESFHGSDVFAPTFSLFRPSLSNYRYVLLHTALPTQFLNSLVACAAALVVSIPVSCMAAYGYSRLRFRGKSALFYGVLVTQVLPATALVIPLYRVWALAHAFNSLVALGIAYAAFNMALAILLVRNFFDNIPRALDDAASLDGCTRFQTFWYVLRPLVTPAVAAASVFVFINAWQDYLLASSLITSSGRFTATVGLYSFEGAFTTNWGAILASSVLVSIPSVLMFVAAQRYLVRVVSGGVKG